MIIIYSSRPQTTYAITWCVIALVVSVTTVPWYMYCEYSLTLFNGEDRHALSLVPSLFLDSSVNPDEYINDMLKCVKDLQYPKSHGSKVRRWKGL